MFYVGAVRQVFLLSINCKWNAWVRDFTAQLEILTPWLISNRHEAWGYHWACRKVGYLYSKDDLEAEKER